MPFRRFLTPQAAAAPAPSRSALSRLGLAEEPVHSSSKRDHERHLLPLGYPIDARLHLSHESYCELIRGQIWDLSLSGIRVALNDSPTCPEDTQGVLHIVEPMTYAVSDIPVELRWTKAEGDRLFVGLKLVNGLLSRSSFLHSFMGQSWVDDVPSRSRLTLLRGDERISA